MVEMRWQGAQVDAALQAAAARGLRLGAEHVLAESRKVVPIQESTLANSGATDVDAASMTASVSYNTPYAARQHEELDWRHDPGRTAKYLENPLNEQADATLELLAQEMRKAL